MPWFDLTAAQQRFIEEGRAVGRAFAGSSRSWIGRSTSCMCGCFFRSTAAMRRARTAAGTRLRAEARAVLLNGQEYLRGRGADDHGGTGVFRLAEAVARRRWRLRARCWKRCGSGCIFCTQVGLDYLTLDRLTFDAFGGRVAADSAGDVAGLAAGGRAVCAG